MSSERDEDKETTTPVGVMIRALKRFDEHGGTGDRRVKLAIDLAIVAITVLDGIRQELGRLADISDAIASDIEQANRTGWGPVE